MVPLLRQGQYFAASAPGVDQMMALIDGEPLPPPDRTWQHQRLADLNFLPFVLLRCAVRFEHPALHLRPRRPARC